MGIPVLDRDHEHLVELLSRIGAPGWAAASPEVMRDTLDDIVRHFVAHARREEMLMRLVGYAHAARHQRSHAALLARLHEIQAVLLRDPGPIPARLLPDLLVRPLLDHITDEDADLKPWVDRLEEPWVA